MQLLNTMNISRKLLVAPVLALLLMLTIALVSYFGLSAQERGLKNIYMVRISLSVQISEIHSAVNGMHADVSVNGMHADAFQYLNWILSAYDMSEVDKLAKSLERRAKQLSTQLAQLNELGGANLGEKKLLATAFENAKVCLSSLDEMIEVSMEQTTKATKVMGTAQLNYDKLNTGLAGLRTGEGALPAGL